LDPAAYTSWSAAKRELLRHVITVVRDGTRKMISNVSYHDRHYNIIMSLLPELEFIVAEWLVQPPLKLKSFIVPDKIDWNGLSQNPNAIHLLEKQLEENPDKINWLGLSQNPNAIHILEKNPDKIDWNGLSSNPNAIHLLEKNPDKINWLWLSENSNAIHLLENQIKKNQLVLVIKQPSYF